MDLSPITLTPVGLVRNGAEDIYNQDVEQMVSEVIIDPALAEGLDDIEEFSHLEVFFVFHRLDREQVTLKRRSRGRPDMPLVGVFALRTQFRPCPLGATVVELVERRENVLLVRGLDAIDGTPVLDIKPYPSRQMLAAEGNYRIPDWARAAWSGR